MEPEKELAFPQSYNTGDGTYHHYGMTLRDYFAAKAMPLAIDFNKSLAGTWPGWCAVAETCYDIADAMLSARAK